MESGAVREIVVERGNGGGDREDDIEDKARREREKGIEREREIESERARAGK